MRPGSLLIFDLDGTLFHTETVTVPATRAAFERHGLAPPSHEAVCAFIGRPGVEFSAWLTTLCPPTVAEQIVRDAAERELELIGESGVLYPGVPEMLADLLRKLGRPAGGGGVVVGDRSDDVESARANGLLAVGCGYGYGRDGELDGADGVAASPAQIVGLVDRLLGAQAEKLV